MAAVSRSDRNYMVEVEVAELFSVVTVSPEAQIRTGLETGAKRWEDWGTGRAESWAAEGREATLESRDGVNSRKLGWDARGGVLDVSPFRTEPRCIFANGKLQDLSVMEAQLRFLSELGLLPSREPPSFLHLLTLLSN